MSDNDQSFCALCRNITLLPHLRRFLEHNQVSKIDAAPKEATYRVSQGDLIGSVAEGCPWCARVEACCWARGTQQPREADVKIVFDVPCSRRAGERDLVRIQLRAIVERLDDPPQQLDPGVYPLSFVTEIAPEAWARPPFDRDRIKALKSRLVMCGEWMHQCWQECTASHNDCLAWESTPLPTRVIDVAPHTPTKTGIAPRSSVKLHVSVPGEHAAYTALSYCWGGLDNLMLTESNMADFRTGLAFDQLPQAMKEAICFTQLIGIRYIWIDALCIVQDSVEDKQKEIRNMRSIFQKTYVTVVASKAASVHSEFTPRPEVVPFTDAPIQGSDVFHLEFSGKKGPSSYHPRDEPVNKRAWTLEERLLSPRLIMFTRAGPIWQCQQVQVEMSEPRRNKGIDSPSPLKQRYVSRITSGSTVQGPRGKLRPYNETVGRMWLEIVDDYSHRTLTRPTDKLVALAGVAEVFSDAWGADLGMYCVGVWSKLALQCMSWRAFESAGQTLKPRPTVYRAPSWSWAAIDAGVGYYNLNESDFIAEVVEMHVEHGQDDHEFGDASAGYVVIRAPTVDAFWAPEQNDDDATGGRLFALEPGTGCEVGFARDVAADCFGAAPKGDVRLIRAVIMQWVPNALYPVYCGLVLEPASHTSYRRIASFGGVRNSVIYDWMPTLDTRII